jgi:ElaB/YqjD/DUF883 family membrane-anchored ribosome-binding protein
MPRRSPLPVHRAIDRPRQEIKMDKLEKLDELIDGAEELLIQLADAYDPNIQRLRDRVDHAIADATRTLSRQDDEASLRLRDIANSIDDYVRDYPWLAVLTGVLVAGTVAFIAGAVVGSKRHS